HRDVALLSSSASSLRMDMRPQCLPEPETVYIDLRDADPQKSVTFPEEEQSASGSSAEEEEPMTIKDKAERRMRNCSGKSFLLQQLRAAWKGPSELLHEVPTPAEKLDPETLENRGYSYRSQKQCCKVNQETKKVIPRNLIGLEPEKNSSTWKTEEENKVEAEK
ncbi:hypothetical protein N310_02000, partial [Acanthisitta chloris]